MRNLKVDLHSRKNWFESRSIVRIKKASLPFQFHTSEIKIEEENMTYSTQFRNRFIRSSGTRRFNYCDNHVIMDSLSVHINNNGNRRFIPYRDLLPTLPPLSSRYPHGNSRYNHHRRHRESDSNPALDTDELVAGQRIVSHSRVRFEDGVAILDFPESRVSVDHRNQDMTLDIHGMSYEELLALGNRIGRVGSGLSDELISSCLKTKIFAADKEDIECCVICQDEYNDEENMGSLKCGHGYHLDCIKKWLLVKNACPMCKASAV